MDLFDLSQSALSRQMNSINFGRCSKKTFSGRVFLFTWISRYNKLTGLANVYFYANLHLPLSKTGATLWGRHHIHFKCVCKGQTNKNNFRKYSASNIILYFPNTSVGKYMSQCFPNRRISSLNKNKKKKQSFSAVTFFQEQHDMATNQGLT